jgi:hypothetical protein
MRLYYTVINHEYIDSKPTPSMTVMSQEPQEKFSGLYDASGNKLYAVERCEPIGFICHTRGGAK